MKREIKLLTQDKQKNSTTYQEVVNVLTSKPDLSPYNKQSPFIQMLESKMSKQNGGQLDCEKLIDQLFLSIARD